MANPPNFPLISYQPLRFVYKLSYFGTIIARLPYYTLVALIPAFRPNSKWSAKQTFMTRILQPLLDMTSRIGITETLTLEQGKEDERFQIVKPSTLDVYQGPLHSESVKPATIGGTWYPNPPQADISSKIVVLYFHGGAFVQGDGRDESTGSIAKKFLEKGGAEAFFSLQYRLSEYGGVNPFPAALQDAVSAYFYLLNEHHIPANQIVIGGDSAGANLATAFLRYLHEYGTEIGAPYPKAAVLLSPWVAPFDYHIKDNRATDFIPTSYPAWGAHTYGNGAPDERTNPYITASLKPFSTPVPIFINAGTAELLYGQIVGLADGMSKVPGNVVELHIEDAAVHDTLLTGRLLGFEESAWEVAAKVGEFVRKL
ncbi:alpha/beta hydrolase fold-3 domain-containing protein [Hypoxylon trugodes]|uniref:alpha/beta hydrolase fold-3 domain-containing protein n=1 Tax=Hypoxylon trugodes TaxID=326681 RepID=UPI002194D4F5|nr:alpha/beta hydrolase fold-3 domain-containing protein [Hypoxylon trugodes]KAI1386964.1 alpha/beta hydrolase fold-3 domain-containing protein [Hypoxylon trugodes]